MGIPRRWSIVLAILGPFVLFACSTGPSDETADTETEPQNEDGHVTVVLNGPSGQQYRRGQTVLDVARIENGKIVEGNRYGLNQIGNNHFRLDLSPGQYQLRAAVLNPQEHHQGNLTEEEIKQHPEKLNDLSERLLFSKRVTIEHEKPATVTIEGVESAYLTGTIESASGKPVKGLFLTVPIAPPIDPSKKESPISFYRNIFGSTRDNGTFWMFNIPPNQSLTLNVWNRRIGKYLSENTDEEWTIIKTIEVDALEPGETMDLGTIQVDRDFSSSD